MNRVKITECPYCKSKNIVLTYEKGIRKPFNTCGKCGKISPEYILYVSEQKQKKRDVIRKNRRESKQEKIIETYLDLAEVIQRAGGSVSIIKDHRDQPLSTFLEDICSTNNIRFKHKK
jgi:uncharacterized Zn finger protein